MKSFWSLFWLLLVGFIDYLGIGLVYPLFSSLFFHPSSSFLPEEFSPVLRGLCLGILLSLMPIFQLISAPFWGKYSDIKGRKPILLKSLSILAFSYLVGIFAISQFSLTLLILSRALAGIGGGSVSVVQAALSDLSAPEEKPHAFALFNMVLGAGFTIGPFLGGKLSEISFFGQSGFLTPFCFSFLLILINISMLSLFFKEASFLKLSLQEPSLKTKIWHRQKVCSLLVCAFIFSFGWSFFFEFVPVYLIGKYHFASSDVGNFYAYSGGFYALSCALFIKPVVKRFTSEAIFLVALFLAGFYSLLFLWVSHPGYFWAYLPPLLFLVALVYPTLTAMISREAGEKEQGKMLGILQSTQSAAFALSPLFSGYLVGVYPHMPILIGGASMLLAGSFFSLFLLFRFLKKTELPKK